MLQSLLLVAPQGTQSSCLSHSDKMFSCCPRSVGCSWTSALCLQEHCTSGHPACSESRKHTRKWQQAVHMNSPVSISQRAKSPMWTSPFTVHFCVSQFGLQLWFINRDKFPFRLASITRSYEGKMCIKGLKECSWSSTQWFGATELPWWGWACRSWSRGFHGHVWFAAATLLSLSPLPHTLSQTHPGRHNNHGSGITDTTFIKMYYDLWGVYQCVVDLWPDGFKFVSLGI